MSLVLDASAALAWLFERTDPKEAKQARKILKTLDSNEALVPALWHIEVVNALAVAQRRGVIELSKASDFLARLGRLPIQTDDMPVSSRRDAIFSLAREYALSAYDASYLELALRSGAALATFDRKLSQASDKAGVPPP